MNSVAEEKILKLTKDIATISEWKKSDKPFTQEQKIFAEQVVDRMFEMRFANKAGIQIVSKANVEWAKAQKIKGEKVDEVDISQPEISEDKRQTPDAANIKLNPPDNQEEGEINSKADLETEAKDSTGKVNEEIPSEELGHNPELPMPKKMAEDLIGNARWGTEIEVYANIESGIDAQLGRKCYAEFIDTDEKMATVKAYLVGMIKETEPEPVA